MRCYGVVREIDPGGVEGSLRQAVGACRFAQNAMLEQVKNSLETGTQNSWSSISLHTTWRQIRSDVAPWFEEVSKEAFQSGCERASLALSNWNASRKGKRAGRKVGFPRFRRRGSNDSVTFTAGKLRACGEKVQLPRIGEVHLKERFEMPKGARITAVTLRVRAGRWFVTFKVREDQWIEPAKRAGSLVGVDFGVGERFATISDGTIIKNPRFFRSDSKRLARAQKSMARKRKGSANRTKAREKVARIQYRIDCKRADFVHKFTTDLIKSHAQIVVEDLNLVGMSKRSKVGFKLGKSVHDVALSEAQSQLEYKASWYGSQIIVADRWFPSSKMCNVCKTINPKLELSDRSWTCSCGAILDRDLNGSHNLRDLAVSSAVSVCGAEVSPEPALAVG